MSLVQCMCEYLKLKHESNNQFLSSNFTKFKKVILSTFLALFGKKIQKISFCIHTQKKKSLS